MDKRIKKNLFAFNIVDEFELKKEQEKGVIKNGWETPIELDFAYMHFFKPSIGLGLEIRNHNKISDFAGFSF